MQSILSVFLALLAFNGFAAAFQYSVTPVSCTQYDWTISLSQSEWQRATYAALYIVDASDAQDKAVLGAVTVLSSGDIQDWNTKYSFTTYVSLSQLPSGSTWDRGIVLLDANQIPIPGEISVAEVANVCTPTSKKSHMGVYIGAAVGGVAFVILVGVGAFFFLRKRRATHCENQQSSGSSLEKDMFVGSHNPINTVQHLPNAQMASPSPFHTGTIGSPSVVYSSPPMSPQMHGTVGPQYGSWQVRA